MSHSVDVVIVGAGVIGLAIASQVARADREVYVLEKNGTFGQEQSSRNSEVIHGGIYYKGDSLKAKLCLEGNSVLYELCEEHGIAYRRCGKIIIATNDAEALELEDLYGRGKENGVPLRMLSRREIGQLEPNLRGIAAFFSPTTGIVDSYSLMKCFLGKARENGTKVAYKTEVIGVERSTNGYEITVREPSGVSSLATRVLVNCAGLYSDKVAEMTGINVNEAKYKLHWCKGEFYAVRGGKNKLVNRLIYPVPTDLSVGVHVCFDVDWRLRLGPLFYYVDEITYAVDESRTQDFLESSIMKALPFVEPSDLEPESAGVIAMLQAQGEGFCDFVIRHEFNRGLPGFINLVGIESPGLTCSPAVAKYVGSMVNEILED